MKRYIIIFFLALISCEETEPDFLKDNFLSEEVELKEEGDKILFSDDFNDNYIDNVSWETITTNVKEENGILKMEQNVANQATQLISKWIAIDSTQNLVVERDVKINNTANSNLSTIDIYFHNNKEELIFVFDIFYIRYHNNPAKSGIYLQSSKTGNIKIREVITDEWFREKIVFNHQLGLIDYYINGVKLKSWDAGIISGISEFNVQFYSLDTHTGYTYYMDNLVVSSTK